MPAWRPWLLAAGAGVALALALPGPGLVPLVLVVPGLLRRALSGARGGGRSGSAGLRGSPSGSSRSRGCSSSCTATATCTRRWPSLAVALMAAILGLTWAIAGWATSRVPEGWRIVALPLALAAFEELQRFPPWIFPWNPVAAALTPVPALLTPLPVTGAIGLSLLALLAGSSLDALLDARRCGAPARSGSR